MQSFLHAPELSRTTAGRCRLPFSIARSRAFTNPAIAKRPEGRTRMLSVEVHEPDEAHEPHQSDLRHCGRIPVMKTITIALLAGIAVLFAGDAFARQGVD